METKKIAIIGGGPAGLTAAYRLVKENNFQVQVFEADEKYVGGISKTVQYKGFHFDIGGHRFFSKSNVIENLWTELLPNDMLVRPRSSRIFYKDKFFSYPLDGKEALFKLGIWEAIQCLASYFKAKLFSKRDVKSFEDWVSNQFGYRLFNIFFKTYTEKVWGMSCKEISADWAAQRIKGLSLYTAIKNAIFKPKKSKDQVIKTLIDSFRYPRKGPGMMWEACAKKINELGGTVSLGSFVQNCSYSQETKKWQISYKQKDQIKKFESEHLISSTSMRELVGMLANDLPQAVIEAAKGLKYRDFLTVALILPERNLFSDNWIYIHDPKVKVGRVQNFKSWSEELVPDQKLCCYGLEYFCFENDGTWNAKDEDLIKLAGEELEKIGLCKASEIIDGCVVRQAKAYPVYDESYQTNVDIIKEALEKYFPTLHLVGRNGMHKYNNQDHAMMTGLLCSENIIAEKKIYDLWAVNQDAEYHESGEAGESSSVSGLRLVPRAIHN